MLLRNRAVSILTNNIRTIAAQERRVFFGLVCIYLLGYVPLITRGGLYWDDMGRAVDGYLNWSSVGRPLADILVLVIGFGRPAVDISPAPQLVAIPVLALAATIVGRVWFAEATTILRALVTAPVGLQPYLHQNMAYRFDALGMALALLLAVFPMAVKLPAVLQFSFSAIAVFASLTLYQPAFNAFLIMCVVAVAKALLTRTPQRHNIATFCGGLTSLVGYCIAVYWLFPRSGYVGDRSSLVSFSDATEVIANNASTAITLVWGHWRAVPAAIPSAFLLLIAGIGGVWAIARGCFSVPAWVALLIAITACAGVLASAQAIQLPLQNPLWDPRTFMSVGVLLALAGSIAAVAGWKRLVTFAAAAQCWSMMIFGYVHANALESQYAFSQQIGADLVYDIEFLRASHQVEAIHVLGSASLSPTARNSSEKYPILNQLVHISLEGETSWSGAKLRTLGLNLKLRRSLSPEEAKVLCGASPVISTGRYQIFVVERVVVVNFSASTPTCN
jgi:hypothetical protein